MAAKLIGFGFLLVCYLLVVEVSSRPSNESTKIELPLDEPQERDPSKQERSITFIKDPSTSEYNVGDIIKKIQAINDGLKKPHRQQQNFYKPPEIPQNYNIDRETLDKIQQIINSAKKKPTFESATQHENNYLTEDPDNFRQENSRSLPISSNGFNQPSMSLASPYPYLTSIPVIIMPSPNNIPYANNDLNSIKSPVNYQTRQDQPSFPSFPNFQWPFQFQWPFANLFPLLVKDPFVAIQQGGGWNNFFEYGQSADVCARKQKSVDNEITNNEEEDEQIKKLLEVLAPYKGKSMSHENTSEEEREESIDPVQETGSRQDRALKKRTIASNPTAQKTETSRKAQKIYVAKPVLVTRKPPKKVYIEEEPEDTKSGATDADLRFPFGGFDWFGNKKPVAPSPGFFINRLRVRKGGVAIAGPGGVATAGRGGTAIVGPGGLAYTQPGGLAVAGPAARVFALSSATDLNSLVTRLRKLNDSSVPLQQPIEEGKLVATGPVIYYHPDEQT